MDVDHPLPTSKEKEALARRYLSQFKLIRRDKPSAIIMTGIPGAGKTEYALELAARYSDVVLIDLDEMRSLFSGYSGAEAHRYQRAASQVLERVLDKVISNQYNFILDGTLQKYDIAKKNIERLLRQHSPYSQGVVIHYVIRDKATAWDFTQKREKVQNRRINRDTFEYACAHVAENVRTLKLVFGEKLQVDLIIKLDSEEKSYTDFNVSSDHHLLQSS